jgi:hypothetical protein
MERRSLNTKFYISEVDYKKQDIIFLKTYYSIIYEGLTLIKALNINFQISGELAKLYPFLMSKF